MHLFRIGVLTGLAGGVLDFAAASIVYPLVYPDFRFLRLWQSVAEGVLGKATYEGGVATASLGIALHFFIALCAGMVLGYAMSWAQIFQRLWVATGAIYGLTMYFFMQEVVLPMSLIGAREPDSKSMAIGLAIHIFIFGLGSAFVAMRLFKGKA